MAGSHRARVGKAVKSAWTFEVREKRPKGSTKLRWNEVMKENMDEKGLRLEHADRML